MSKIKLKDSDINGLRPPEGGYNSTQKWTFGNQTLTPKEPSDIAIDLIYLSKKEREKAILNLSHSRKHVLNWLKAYDENNDGQIRNWFQTQYKKRNG